MNLILRNALIIVPTIAASATAFFYGTGLHPCWYLTWIAPLPVLLLALKTSPRLAGLTAFVSMALGNLNMWSYYRMIIPLPAVFFVLLAPPLFLAALILAFRSCALHGQTFRAALIVPVLWTAGEYLLEFQSPNSTFGNLAYTQMDFLPLIQIVAVTGLWSISFLLFLLPSALAALTAPNANPKQRSLLALAALVVFTSVLGYGFQRLHTKPEGALVGIGCLSTDTPKLPYPEGREAMALISQYSGQIPSLARQGVQVVVMPEKIGRFNDQEMRQVDQRLGGAARASHVTIVAGFRHLPDLNESRVYSPDGTLEATYEKHHMLAGFETALLPGKARTVLTRPSGKWGLTICKDMDFPALSRQYGQDGAGLLLVPAWDFVEDGWLHGRMSILRGIESGFSIARTAREGRLTMTNNRGQVLADQKTGTAQFDSVTATVPVTGEPTFYDRAGDWFPWLDLILAAVFLLQNTRTLSQGLQRKPSSSMLSLNKAG